MQKDGRQLFADLYEEIKSHPDEQSNPSLTPLLDITEKLKQKANMFLRQADSHIVLPTVITSQKPKPQLVPPSQPQ